MKLIQTIRSVDPLIGFTLAGGAIFLLHALVAEPPIERERIEVTATTVDEIIRLRSEILSRPLTDEERAELIEQFVDEEILVREAVARGLHLADGKVRQRLRERMEFLLAESAPEPTAADLDRLRARHPNRYKTPQTVTFEHVFFAEDRGAAAALLEEVRDAARMPEAAGERFWLGRRMERYSASQLLVVLGAGFVDALGAMPTGEWTGPIESGRGWHLVRLESFHPPEPLPEEELQRRLRADWMEEQRLAMRSARIAALHESYEVVLPEAGTAEAALAQTALSIAEGPR